MHFQTTYFLSASNVDYTHFVNVITVSIAIEIINGYYNFILSYHLTTLVNVKKKTRYMHTNYNRLIFSFTLKIINNI